MTAHTTCMLCYLFQDYFSVPQIGEYLQGDTSDLIKAVNSIPSYIERCSHFFACVPSVKHNDREGVMCDFGSWLSRGWCRLEMFSLLFTRSSSKLPVIVVKGGECEPYMISATMTNARPPGSGDFTCCMRDHKMKEPDGTERGIPCDKVKIGQLVWTMLQSKLSYMLGGDQIAEYRLWLALVPHFMQGLPDNGAALKASHSCVSSSRLDAAEAEDAVKDFLATYHFKTAKDEEGRGESGMSPLRHAVMVGNVEVAAELIKQGANVDFKLQKFNTTTGLDADMTTLHNAVAVCPARQMEMITVLLRAGADANAPSKSGITPLMAGVAYHHVPGVTTLLECAKDTLDLERGFRMNNATALCFAAYAGTPELCEILIKAGASRKSKTDHGLTKLHDACCNVATTKLMLDLIWNNGEFDINAVSRSTTTFWKLIDIYFQMGIKSGLMTKSQFVKDMAHAEGSTPLHYSAMNGLIDVTEWLLHHGAHKSLRIRNKMGATPLDVARIFGPYPAIEAMLGAAMLNRQFDTQFAIRRGSLLRKQAGGVIEPDDVSGDAPLPVENRPAESTTLVETITHSSESASTSGKDATVVEEQDAAVGTHTSPSVATRGQVQIPTVDSSTVADVGAALTVLSSSVEARFVSMQTENAQLRMQNTEIMAKLDVLLSKTITATYAPHQTPGSGVE